MADPTLYSFVIKDSAGVTATVVVFTAYDATTETVSALFGNYVALGGVIDTLTDGQILEGRIIIPVFPDPSWKAAPVADSNVEKTALFNFRPDGTKYRTGIDIPAAAGAILDAKQRIILTSTPVVNLISNITGSIGGSSTVFAQSKASQALKVLVDAVTTFRKHRRSLDRVTTEIV